MDTVTTSPDAIASSLRKWDKKLNVEVREDESVVATAKSIDVDSEDLKFLAKLVGDRRITFGRSGANFRMSIW